MFFFIEFDSMYLTTLAFKQEAYCTRKFQKPQRICLKDTLTRAYIYFEFTCPKCYFRRQNFFFKMSRYLFHYNESITSIYQPTNAHIISHKTILKHFKTLRNISILSYHQQGALFLAKVILQHSQFNSYLQTRCCGSISCCVGMCCGEVATCASYRTHT